MAAPGVPAMVPPVQGPGGLPQASTPDAATGGAEGAGATLPPFPFFAPSFDLAVVGMAGFLALAAVHIGLMIKTRAWYFNLLPQASLMLGAGMTLRVVLISFPDTAGVLATPGRILLMVPAMLTSLQLYFTYTRLMWWTTPPENRNISTLWLPPRATTFVLGFSQTIGDILGTLGTGQFAPSPGPRTLSIGAIISMFVFISFTGLAARFTYMSRQWSMGDRKRQASLKLGIALAVSGFFLSIRGIVQVMEQDAIATLMATGVPTPVISTEEWPSWVFNFLPLFLIHFIMANYHPGQVLPRRIIGFRLNTRGLLKDERAGKFINNELGSSRFKSDRDDGGMSFQDQIKYPIGYAA